MTNVILIFGGKSGEHEVSLKSAQSIFNGFNKDFFSVFPIGVGKNGKWYGPIKENDIKSFNENNYLNNEITMLPRPGNSIYDLNNFKEIFNGDIVFPIIHGTNGEDGTLQGLLEYMEIPYIGSGVCGSAVGMDKLIMKDILKSHNIPQVNYLGVTSDELNNEKDKVIMTIEDTLMYPLFIKPANLGSSVGISKAKNKDELEKALDFAVQYDRRIIIEEGKDIREIEVSALGNNFLKLSSCGEVIPGSEFYDYESKYIKDTSVTRIADDLSLEVLDEIKKLSKTTYKVLDLAGFTRIDFFIDKISGEILLNEVNTLPGFTAISMYPKLWQNEGLSLENLLEELVSLGFERFKEKEKYKREL